MVTELCGCGIRFAIGLMRCPRCQAVSARFAGVVKEDAVPRITVAGGPSNAAAVPGEVGHVPPAEDAPPGQWKGERGPELIELPAGAAVFPAGWTQVEAVPDYGSMTQAALRDEAKTRGLPVGGSKADLAARLAEHDAAQLPAEAVAVLAQGGD
jgi:hypothetical protein